MDYVHAIEANHLELAMTYVHAASPHRARLETELEHQLSWYFERAQTLSFGPTVDGEDTVSAPVVQRVVRVFGMKFSYGKRRSIFVFRRQREGWRIWNIQSLEA